MIKINVTEDHIKNGLPGRCSYCPVALAVIDVCKPDVQVDVYQETILLAQRLNPCAITEELRRELFKSDVPSQPKNGNDLFSAFPYQRVLPPEAQDFIKVFDTGHAVWDGGAKPFSFEIDIPDRFLKGFPDG